MFDEMKIIVTPGRRYHHTIGIKNPQVGMVREAHAYVLYTENNKPKY